MSEEELFEQSIFKYWISCEVNDNAFEFPVEKSVDSIVPKKGQYLHTDIILDYKGEDVVLKVVIECQKSGITQQTEFGKSQIEAFLDGQRLHLPPTPITAFLGKHYQLDYGETDGLEISVYENGSLAISHSISIVGPWPSEGKLGEEIAAEFKAKGNPLEQLNLLDDCIGWGNFKHRMEEVVNQAVMARKRQESGLAEIKPRLHTVIVGNPGTGKNSCVPFLVNIYKKLGYLDSDEIHTTSAPELYGIGAEFTNTGAVVAEARGATLVFDNAHELFRQENKNNYESEPRIIKSLEDALANTKRQDKWMMVLVGESDGIESLLASNPNLKRHFNPPVYMEDFTPRELLQIAEGWCRKLDLTLSAEARNKLESYLTHLYNHRGPGFQNARAVQTLIEERVVPAMFNRIREINLPTAGQLKTVEASDIPSVQQNATDALAQLDALVGLGKIKTRVRDYLNAVQLAGRRMEKGLNTNMPRLHMAFLGNPGTGKTTVAEIIGKVFASWGILSGGRVIRTEKTQMIGQYIGETELKMRHLLNRARGNILFIDEAYQLVEGGPHDYGRIVMDSLLTELGKDNQDMVVILAGYTAPMKQLMESNAGIESRFPNVFNFEDYTADELVEIGKMMVRKQGFELTPGAEENMRAIIAEESEKPSPRFGNGRFVSNLLQNEILATLGKRTARIENPTKEDLSLILAEDVVIGKAQKDVVFDDVAIDAALARLDALAGLEGVKKAIHNFVKSARHLHSIGEPYVGKGLLSWRFVGRSGTGKSTVAEIMASILKGMRLIANSHITQIKGERILGMSDHECDNVLREALKRSCNGLIFIDVDDTKFSDDRFGYGRNIERIRLRMEEMTLEMSGECAVIIAELSAPNLNVAEQLSEAGIYEFDHTLLFKDFSADELYQILCICLGKHGITFDPAAEKHMREYLVALKDSINANARTMKLMSRTIHQQVILREAGLSRRPAAHQVRLADIETFKWNGRKGRIGY